MLQGASKIHQHHWDMVEKLFPVTAGLPKPTPATGDGGRTGEVRHHYLYTLRPKMQHKGLFHISQWVLEKQGTCKRHWEGFKGSLV